MLYNKEWDKKLPAPVTEPWQRVLIGAADLIERDGWCQFALFKDDGRVCAIGAMWFTTDRHTAGAPYQEARRRLEAYLAQPFPSIPDWNNAPERTQAEVVAALRACAVSP